MVSGPGSGFRGLHRAYKGFKFPGLKPFGFQASVMGMLRLSLTSLFAQFPLPLLGQSEHPNPLNPKP